MPNSYKTHKTLKKYSKLHSDHWNWKLLAHEEHMIICKIQIKRTHFQFITFHTVK